MREDGAWTQEDISALQNAVRPIDEQFSADGGKFLVHDNLSVSSRWRDANGGVEVLNGQAALSSLLARVHANISVMNEDGEDLDVELAQLKKELEGSFATLERLEKRVGGYTIADLFGISKRLHDLDSCRGTTGKFPHSNAKTGHATVAGILNSCFDKLVALVAALDPVPADSPLQKINQSLIQIHVDLQAIAFASTKPNQDQEQLISLLDSAQERLESLEVKFRFNGTFVPDGNECSFPLSVRLAGQTTLHKMLHDCHALITRLIDPFAAPVGEALFSTYEILLKERAILRRLRRWSSAGWDVSESVTQVEFTLKNIEEHRVKGFFVGKALNSYSGSGVKVATEGQVAVSALFDECDSLIWQINLTSQ
ncbi:hypothetical protein HK100_004230 [Physocladia obscura]|uniref:Uncharacterized protein n=1 Tax=Physocladia obscura TaxID=109957 RepID=A0AAD5SYU1_9FUNG|nr:hypothetical protein HK100_004230 [Physocladia obscura]